MSGIFSDQCIWANCKRKAVLWNPIYGEVCWKHGPEARRKSHKQNLRISTLRKRTVKAFYGQLDS